jgi:glutamate 5-kinase
MDSQLAHKKRLLSRVRRVVIKIGSNLLSTVQSIDHTRLRRLVDEVCDLRAREYEIIVVSSGAVAAGLARLGLRERPKTIPQRQAAAAVGQISLMALYEEYFSAHGQHVAQILLTHDDLANRRRYLNARHAMDALLAAGIVPVVNENDTVVVEEMKFNFGDNDNLSALAATLVDADLLVILSDVSGLYTADPKTHADAELVPLVPSITKETERWVTGPTTGLGTGGMATKLKAAFKATEAGIPCVIADGQHAGVLQAVFDPETSAGTLFLPKGDRLTKRKHWIAHTLRAAGSILVDQGAYEAVVRKGRSLLPKGVTAVEGTFGAGDCVACLTPARTEFARGLVNYSSVELGKIKGAHSTEIETRLGYKISDEVIHRNDLVLLD